MQAAANSKIRRTPFGDCYGYRAERLNPFNVRTGQRKATRRAPRLSAGNVTEIRRELGARGVAAQTLSTVVLRLSYSLFRLALRGIGARLLEKMRRAAPMVLNDYRRRAWLDY